MLRRVRNNDEQNVEYGTKDEQAIMFPYKSFQAGLATQFVGLRIKGKCNAIQKS